ncbi:MAG TPA: transglutaminaseTgpA domain-containing protein [Acidimicrobiales bacterium]|nr:transglutaminaseTgpA domain-containing protein [Acidimicrobiales bacterium]
MSAVEDRADTFDADPPQPGWPAELGLVGMSVAAAVGMGRLFADASFLPVVLFAVLTCHGLSMLCRRGDIGPLGTTAVSATGLVLFVTWVIEPHVSLVPGPAVWDAALTDLDEAWGRFSEVVAPAQVTRGFLLGAVLGAWISAFAADLFAFRARTRVEAVVPSFTVFLFGALLGADRHRLSAALLYLSSVLVFVVLAEVSAAPRPRPWLAGRRARGEAAMVRSGLAMAAVALVLAVAVGPSLPGAYAKGVLGVGDGSGGKSGTRVTLSPLVDIRDRLVGQSSVELFTVATDTPTYWRITSLDRFNGDVWSSLSNYRPAGNRLPAPGADATRGTAERSKQEFVISGLSSIWLPAAYRPERLSPSDDVRFDPDSGSLATDEATSDGMRYTVESALPRLRAEELSSVSGVVPPDIASRYLDLPPNLSRLVRRTAQEVAGEERTPYRRAKALQDWFRTNFQYNLQVPQGHHTNAIDQFLQSRQGYCEQFAGTYAAMARLLGLPARVAVGFTSGTRDAEGRWHVTGKEAHAWPEVYLSGFGWVAFEPTPGRGLPGAEDYTEVPPAQAADTTVQTVPETTAPLEQLEPDQEITEPAAPAPVEESTAGRRWLPVAGLVAVLVVLYTVGVPLAKRRRVLRRREGAVTPADRVLVAWAEATEDMAAAGFRARPDETAPEYAHRVCRAAGPAGPALVRLADDTSAAAWSAGGVAVEVAARAEREGAYVAGELKAQAGWRERLVKALDPRPLVGRGAGRPVATGDPSLRGGAGRAA